MTDDAGQEEDALAQAAQWHARLNTLPVSRDTLDAFFAWRREPGNREAFGAVEEIDTRARRLACSPAIEGLAQAAWERGRARQRTTKLHLRAVALCALLLAVGGVAWRSWRVERETFSTAVGERREIALQDGSIVMLDTDTRLSVGLSRHSRDVMLEQGQAFFTVAHDASRPFTVRAGHDSVTATGTQFDVRHVGTTTLVALLKGGVDIRANDVMAARLTPGQEWRAQASGTPIVEPVALDRITAWTTDRIVLDNVPLVDALAEVNRYLVHPIMLDATDHAQVRISGSLRTGDAQAFIAAVGAVLPLTAVADKAGAIHLRDTVSADSRASL